MYKYQVQIYCSVTFPLNNAQMAFFKWKKLIPNGVTTHYFKTEAEFYSYVRKFDYYSRDGKIRNCFLEATLCNPNDALRHRQGFDRWKPDVWSEDFFQLGYLTKDDKNKVIDLRNYTDELYAFDVESYINKNHEIWLKKHRAARALRETYWDKTVRLREGEKYWSYWRRIRTTQERKLTFNDEYAGLIRSKRSFPNIPHQWDDFYFHREKSWKARSKKAHRQYEINIPKHIDTYKLPSLSSDDEGDLV